MHRRTVLRAAAASPVVSVFSVQPVVATADDELLREVSQNFFGSLREKQGRQEIVVGCANEFCRTQRAVSEETLQEITSAGESTGTAIRRARFGVRILTEYGITNAIDESMVEAGERTLKQYDRYIPLVKSYNNCRDAACAVDESNPETIKRFLFAVFAFGAEVAMWYVGVPYKVAWRSTRFISNRTFLRLAKHGCRGCVAFAMSELHWAVRASIYNVDKADEVITENRVEFVVNELSRLQKHADDTGYDVELQTDRAQVVSFIGDATEQVDRVGDDVPSSRDSGGFVDRWIPEFDFDIDLPEPLREWF